MSVEYIRRRSDGVHRYKDLDFQIRHRVGAPATEYEDGSKMWYGDGKQHQSDVACESSTGFTTWWIDGMRHREDGPAIVRPSGENERYLNGCQLTEAEHAMQTCPAVDMSIAEIEAALGKKIKIVK